MATKEQLELMKTKDEITARGVAFAENGKWDELAKLNKEELAPIIDQINKQANLDNSKREDSGLAPVQSNYLDRKAEDMKNFASFIRNQARGFSNTGELTKGDNGALIPTTIINMIVTKVTDLCPIYALSTKYSIKGNIDIPVEDESSDEITVAYSTEFSDLVSHSSKTTSIQLTGYLYGALTKVSRSLINSSTFDIVTFVVNRMASKIAGFLERELIKGTSAKSLGILGSYDTVNNKKVLASKTAVTSDELIDIQAMIPTSGLKTAVWLMSKKTYTAIRKLKDGQNNYLLQKDFNAGPGQYSLLGSPVYPTTALDDMGSVNTPVIIYGALSALAVKESETPEIQILNENLALQHAVGVVVWGEVDAKVSDTQFIAVAVDAAA